MISVLYSISLALNLASIIIFYVGTRAIPPSTMLGTNKLFAIGSIPFFYGVMMAALYFLGVL
jgi:hypothetical protein